MHESRNDFIAPSGGSRTRARGALSIALVLALAIVFALGIGVTTASAIIVGPTAQIVTAPDSAFSLPNDPAVWNTTNVDYSIAATESGGSIGTITVNGANFTDGQLAIGADGKVHEPTTTVSFEGTTTVEYLAVDGFGTPSSLATALISIDKTPPITTANVLSSYIGGASIVLNASDAVSGVKETHYILDGVPLVGNVVTAGVGSHTLIYWSVDNAGNEGTHIGSPLGIPFVVTPPVTTIKIAPPGAAASWVNTDVTFSLTATDGAPIGPGVKTIQYAEILPNGTPVATVTVSPGETRTVSAATNEGTTTVLYSATDNNDVTATPVPQLVRIDTHAPETTLSAPFASSYAGTATISLVASDSLSGVAAIHWTLNGVPGVGASVVSTHAGSNTLTFYSVDNAGNTEAVKTPTPATFLVADVTPPVTTISLVPTSAASSWVNTSVVFSLNAADNVGVAHTYYYLTGATSSATTTYSVPTTLSAEGTTTVHFWSTDTALVPNVESTKTQDVRIDRTPPLTTSDAVSAYVSTATISVTASDALSGVAPGSTFLQLDSGPFVATTTVTTSTLGAHKVNFYSTDRAGNKETTETANFTINSPTPTPPTTTIGLVPSAALTSWVNTNVTFTLTATDGPTGQVANSFYALGAGSSTTYTAPVTLTSEGTTTVHYWSVDTTGNVETSHSVDVRIDKTPPQTTSNALPTYAGVASITLSASDALSGVASTQFKLDDEATQTSNANPTVVTTNEPGSHTLAFFSVDNAGNAEAVTTVPFTVTPVAPKILYLKNSTAIAYKIKSLLKTTFSTKLDMAGATGKLVVKVPGKADIVLFNGAITAPAGANFNLATWNGLDKSGHRLTPSSYTYQLTVTKLGKSSTASSKITVSNVWFQFKGTSIAGAVHKHKGYLIPGNVNVYISASASAPSDSLSTLIVAPNGYRLDFGTFGFGSATRVTKTLYVRPPHQIRDTNIYEFDVHGHTNVTYVYTVIE